MKIICQTDAQFYDACYAMLVRGATFEANHSTLTITLTGGF
jgi:hypothetical protein